MHPLCDRGVFAQTWTTRRPDTINKTVAGSPHLGLVSRGARGGTSVTCACRSHRVPCSSEEGPWRLIVDLDFHESFRCIFGAFDTSLGILARPALASQPTTTKRIATTLTFACRRSPSHFQSKYRSSTRNSHKSAKQTFQRTKQTKPKQPSHSSPTNSGVGYGGWPTARTPITTRSNLRIT